MNLGRARGAAELTATEVLWALLGLSTLPEPALLPEHCRLSSTQSQLLFTIKQLTGGPNPCGQVLH